MSRLCSDGERMAPWHFRWDIWVDALQIWNPLIVLNPLSLAEVTHSSLLRAAAAAAAKSLQSCPTLCNPMDYSLSGSSVHGILQARILEWVAMPPPGDLPSSVQSLSHAQLFATPWLQHIRLPCPSSTPRACSNSYPLSHLPHPGNEPASLTSPALADGFFPTSIT